MEPTVDIVPFGIEHRAGLLRLWTTFFGAWSAARLEQRWSWQFDANPFRHGPCSREPVILVGLAHGEVVGHLAGIPIPMILNGIPQTVLAASGLVADDSHRWLGFRLVRSLLSNGPVFACAMSDAARQLIVKGGGLPVGHSNRRFVFPRRYAGDLARKIRWRLPAAVGVGVTPGLCRIAAPWYIPRGEPVPRRLPAPPDGADIRPIERFGNDADALWRRVSRGASWTVDRTSTYLNWRYVQCPTLHAIRLGHYDTDGLLTGIAVAVQRAIVDRAARPCARKAEIVEFMADEPDSPGAEALLAGIMHAIDGPAVDCIGTGALHESLHPLLRRLGFLPRDSGEFSGVLCPGRHQPLAGTWENSPGWYYTAGDGDSLFSSGL